MIWIEVNDIVTTVNLGHLQKENHLLLNRGWLQVSETMGNRGPTILYTYYCFWIVWAWHTCTTLLLMLLVLVWFFLKSRTYSYTTKVQFMKIRKILINTLSVCFIQILPVDPTNTLSKRKKFFFMVQEPIQNFILLLIIR